MGRIKPPPSNYKGSLVEWNSLTSGQKYDKRLSVNAKKYRDANAVRLHAHQKNQREERKLNGTSYGKKPSDIEYQLKYKAAHKEEQKVKAKAYNVKNADKIKAKRKARRIKNKVHISAIAKKSREIHPETVAAYRATHKETATAYSKEYYITHKEQIKARKRAKSCSDARAWWAEHGGGVFTEDVTTSAE
jgi:hypothetical protein